MSFVFALASALALSYFPYICPVLRIYKIFSIAMSMYLMALVVLPCNDTCGIEDHVAPLTISPAQDHHDDGNDFCSPFCVCSCCSYHVIIPSSLLLVAHGLLIKKDFSEYTAIHDMGPQYSIWQPPRLG